MRVYRHRGVHENEALVPQLLAPPQKLSASYAEKTKDTKSQMNLKNQNANRVLLFLRDLKDVKESKFYWNSSTKLAFRLVRRLGVTPVGIRFVVSKSPNFIFKI